MRYVIQRDYINLEFGYRFEQGGVVNDALSGLEPDLIANLVSLGVLRDENAPNETKPTIGKSKSTKR